MTLETRDCKVGSIFAGAESEPYLVYPTYPKLESQSRSLEIRSLVVELKEGSLQFSTNEHTGEQGFCSPVSIFASLDAVIILRRQHTGLITA